MSLFHHFNSSIVSDIKKIDKDIGLLLDEFKKSVSRYEKKCGYLKEFIKGEKKGMLKDYPKLVKEFTHALLEELSLEKKEEKTSNRSISDILEVIRKGMDQEDLKRFGRIRQELRMFIEDLHAWHRTATTGMKVSAGTSFELEVSHSG